MGLGVLDRSRTVAPQGWSRWLVPPAALAVHLSIGQAYAWSVFKTPLEKALNLNGVESGLPFQIAIVMLGLSAAFGGTLVEHRGPRWAMAIAASAFGLGFLIAALGVETKQFWLVVVGYGLVGGIGLGIGYISPVSTLIKWFPDRPGMATGVAIMGFGGGALIASPWSTAMLAGFGTSASGIAETFAVHGVVYAIFMAMGVFLIRVPAPGWRPAGWDPAQVVARPLVTTANVSARNAIRTPQFWLLWLVLCLNVTAGIGILEKASPMIVDFFKVGAAPAAGFVALLSLTNMLGRFVWSSTSDAIGRKNMYRVYLGVGVLLYLVLVLAGASSKAVFVIAAMLILSFYGGGFATVPAYLRDLFGTFEVGAIHGRLLTAWSVAGVAGPLIIDGIADAQHAAGRSGPALYTLSFYIMIGLLIVGFVANELIKPVNPKFHEPATELAAEVPVDEAAKDASGTTDKAGADESGAAAKAEAEKASADTAGGASTAGTATAVAEKIDAAEESAEQATAEVTEETAEPQAKEAETAATEAAGTEEVDAK